MAHFFTLITCRLHRCSFFILFIFCDCFFFRSFVFNFIYSNCVISVWLRQFNGKQWWISIGRSCRICGFHLCTFSHSPSLLLFLLVLLHPLLRMHWAHCGHSMPNNCHGFNADHNYWLKYLNVLFILGNKCAYGAKCIVAWPRLVISLFLCSCGSHLFMLGNVRLSSSCYCCVLCCFVVHFNNSSKHSCTISYFRLRAMIHQCYRQNDEIKE